MRTIKMAGDLFHLSCSLEGNSRERGFGLMLVIILIAFLMTLGITMLSITGTGIKVAGNTRLQEQAFNAAEAGFDSAWASLEQTFSRGTWISFAGHYMTEPAGIDLPSSFLYFRRKTDEEIFAFIDPDGDGTPNVNNVLYYRQPFLQDSGGSLKTNITYTVFLIDDEAGGVTPDSSDALMVCIGTVGTGSQMTTARIEIEVVNDASGGS